VSDDRQGLTARFDRIHYGADYNPEHWSPEVWEEDIKLMSEWGSPW